MRRILIFTGIAGIVGGVGTLVLGSSCDIECVQDTRPSVIVRFHEPDGSSLRPVSATEVSYELRSPALDEDSLEEDMTALPRHQRAGCLDEGCTRWAVGADQSGTFEIDAEVCGRTYTASADVPLSLDGCHAETQYLDVEVDCEEVPPMDSGGERCDASARPSVFVYVAQQYDDYLQAVPVDRVWFEYEGRIADARCAAVDTSGACATWVAGWDMPGRFRVFTSWCDTEVSQTVSVEATEDGCHVDTEFVVLPVSTRGCLETEPERPDTPHPPGWLPDDPSEEAYG